MLQKAETYSELLIKGLVNTQAEIARKEGLTRARVTQIMNLNKLAPEIKNYLKNMENPDEIQYLNEKHLRPLIQTKDHQKQIRKFEEIKRRLELKNQFTRWVV
jgi:ParB-like chromosome segregation protein Spo0J